MMHHVSSILKQSVSFDLILLTRTHEMNLTDCKQTRGSAYKLHHCVVAKQMTQMEFVTISGVEFLQKIEPTKHWPPCWPVDKLAKQPVRDSD